MDARISLLDLPECVLSLIPSFLSLDDFRNYRLTCITLNQSTYTHVAMQRFNIKLVFDSERKPRYLYRKKLNTLPKDISFFSKFMDKLIYGKICSITIRSYNRSVSEDDIQCTLLHNLKNIFQLKTDTEHVEIIGKCCPSLQELNIDENLPLHKSGNNFFNGLKESSFTYFNSLTYLSISNANYSYRALIWILKGIRTLTSFVLLKVGFYDELTEIEKEDLRKSVRNATTIKYWSLAINSVAENLELHLPDSVTWLKCRVPDNFLKWNLRNLANFYFEKFRDFDIFSVPWNPEEYANLNRITFHAVEFSESCLPVCRHVKYLKLFMTKQTVLYLKALSLFPADELKELLLCYSINATYDADLADVLNSFRSLEYIQIVTSCHSDVEPLVTELSKRDINSIKWLVYIDDYGIKKIVNF